MITNFNNFNNLPKIKQKLLLEYINEGDDKNTGFLSNRNNYKNFDEQLRKNKRNKPFKVISDNKPLFHHFLYQWKGNLEIINNIISLSVEFQTEDKTLVIFEKNRCC